jgi:hypothetical protein
MTTLELVHLRLSEPGFADDNDGYALPADIARITGHHIARVVFVLILGQQHGLFVSRPHPRIVSARTGRPPLEYKAVQGRDPGQGIA